MRSARSRTGAHTRQPSSVSADRTCWVWNERPAMVPSMFTPLGPSASRSPARATGWSVSCS